MAKLILKSKHRLMIGDSTKQDDIAKLMGGEEASLCFTSPPYAEQRDYRESSGNVSGWDSLMRGVFQYIPLSGDGQLLVNLGLVHRNGEWWPYWDGWIEWMRQQGWKRFGWYVWDQGPGMPGDWNGRLAPSHEFVFHFCRQSIRPVKARECVHAGQKHGGKGQRGKDGKVKVRSAGHDPVQSHAIHDSVLRVNRQGASAKAEGHPAPYPIGLPTIALESWEGNIYEPFAGSGTTLIAAENMQRRSFNMEISPGYCAVILERYSKAYPNQKCVLHG